MIPRLRGENLVDEGRAGTDADDLEVAAAGFVEHGDEGIEILGRIVFLTDRIQHDGRTVVGVQDRLDTHLGQQSLCGCLVQAAVRVDEEHRGEIVGPALRIGRSAVDQLRGRPLGMDDILRVRIRNEAAARSGNVFSDFPPARLGEGHGDGETRRHDKNCNAFHGHVWFCCQLYFLPCKFNKFSP